MPPCSAGRKEMLEEICPPWVPTESVSTTQRLLCQRLPAHTAACHPGMAHPSLALSELACSRQETGHPQLAAAPREPARLPWPLWAHHPPCPQVSHCFHLQPHSYCMEQARSLSISPLPC